MNAISVSAVCAVHVSCRYSAMLLAGFCLWFSVVGPAQADQLVFGSFRSAVNATNWATKLQATLGETFSVVAVPDGSQVWHRVVTDELDEQSLQRVQRRADADGIRYWRLLPSAADAAEPGIVKPPPLGGARLVPPGPVQKPPEPTGSAALELSLIHIFNVCRDHLYDSGPRLRHADQPAFLCREDWRACDRSAERKLCRSDGLWFYRQHGTTAGSDCGW